MKTDGGSPRLIEQQRALGAYLDALLCEEPAADAASPVTAAGALVPAWGQGRFQVQLFRVAGLTLAVPLARLHGVVAGGFSVTGVAGYPSQFLGVTTRDGRPCTVVDTARVVLPPAHAERLGASATRARQLLVVDEGRWALACSGVGEVLELEREDVRWRTEAGKRQWLAGTLADRACALLDLDVLGRQLEAATPALP